MHAGVSADDLGAAPACAAELGVLCPLAGLPQPAVAALARAVGLPDFGATEGASLPAAAAAPPPRVMVAGPQLHQGSAGGGLVPVVC